MASDHEFGGPWTELKLDLLKKYLASFTTALRDKFPDLWYIDAFAGTGERTVRIGVEEDPFGLLEPITRHPGSARLALENQPRFTKLVFMDRDPSHCSALRDLAAQYPCRDVSVIEGDANAEIRKLLSHRSWRGTRGVIFLDPYGMNVDWATLEHIRATEAFDVWYLVSLAGLFRQAARRISQIDEGKRNALNRMLGTDAWEQAWYTEEREPGLFGHNDPMRPPGVEPMETFVKKRLGDLFPKVLGPRRLYSRNVPQFALFFAMSNPEPRAIGLATRIAGHILNSGNSSQVRPR